MKKFLTLLILSAMVLSCFAAVAEVTYPVKEPATITWWHCLRAPSYQSSHNDNICWQQIAKDVGVEIEWIHPASGTETEQLNLLLMGDKLPHIIQIDGYLESAGGAAALVDDGVAVDLTDYLE